MKKSILILLITLLGCTAKQPGETVQISLTNSGRNLKVTGIGDDIIHEIDRDTVTTGWQSLIPVYRMPADSDMKDFQKPQPGKYVVENNAVMFTPDTPFIKRQTYFVRYYQYGKGNTVLDYIKQDKKLGKTSYIDLIFKP